MKKNAPTHLVAITVLAVLFIAGCDRGSKQGDAHDDHTEGKNKPAATNRINIPIAVRTNLGISFIEVERRQVQKTLRVPGRFEYQPSARREYRTPLPGRVELAVDQFDRIEAGAVLYRIDAPGWRSLQQRLTESSAEIERLKAILETLPQQLAAHEKHEQSLQETIKVWQTRVEQLGKLNEAGGGRINELTQARASLSSTRADLANVQEKKATLIAEQKQAAAGIKAAESRRTFLIDSAAAVTSLSRAELVSVIKTNKGDTPRWTQINKIEVRCDIAGVVSHLGLTNGAWTDEKTPVLTVVQPDRLRFRASGLQSDLGALRDGLPAQIVPPTPTAVGLAIPMSDVMTGNIMLGLEGDPDDRTTDLFVVPDSRLAWARPGVSAQLEIVIDPAADAELAIPLAAVQRDGLTPVIFRRVPGNPNQVMRLEADLGRDDGRWIELFSGVAEGDEIVLDGGFQLLLSNSGSVPKGGHFHADGTFHEGEH